MAPFRRYLNKSKDNVRSNARPQKAFHSSRLHEPQSPPLDRPSPPSESEQDLEVSEQGSSSEDEDFTADANPYNALLVSLNSQTHPNEPSRKKRKIHEGLSRDSWTSLKKPVSLDPQPNSPVPEDIDQPINDQEDALGNAEASDVDSDDDGQYTATVNIEGLSHEVLDPFQKHFNDVNGDRLKLSIQHLKDQPSKPEVTLQIGYKITSVGFRSSKPQSEYSDSASNSTLSAQGLCVKERLRSRAQKLLSVAGRGIPGAIARDVFSYQDFLFCSRTQANSQALQNLLSVHVLNHILKTRNGVLKNNTRLSKSDSPEDLECRDQGFTRPKVLVLLPTRQSCAQFIENIVSLYQPEQQENKKRFTESYTQNSNDISQDKPSDFRDLFAGNDDDLFRLGLKFTRKTVKFFSPFYSSDIIFASPLGLRTAMGAEGAKKQDSDFLSSIEIVLVDRADALLMQNWEHVEHVFNHVNQLPKEAHDCDFSRVKSWYLDGNAQHVRQTVVLSSFNTPELNQLYTRRMLNVEGKLKVAPSTFDGAIVELGVSIKQTFVRFDALEPQKDPDARFASFKSSIVPTLTKSTKSGTGNTHGILIFIPSYMDFVRVRNFLANSVLAQNIAFGSISEYTTPPDVARARSHFLSGRHSVLLYTGRSHHFRRYKIRGVKQTIMYGLPDNPVFYKEIAGEFIARTISEGRVTPEDSGVQSLFCKWDILKLERIVGSERLKSMVKGSLSNTFDFI